MAELASRSSQLKLSNIFVFDIQINNAVSKFNLNVLTGLIRCLGNLKTVGTTSARRRVVLPVRSKHSGVKWFEHRTAVFAGQNLSLFIALTHPFRSSGLLCGNLSKLMQHA